MKYTPLGRSGLKVSRLCLGTMNFGGMHVTEIQSREIMDRAIELGINFFDTADVYGPKRGEGITEQIVGNWFAQGGNRRQRTIIATKCWNDMDLDPDDRVMKRGLSAVKIRRACENSLRRLQTDYIDLYQMHHVSRETPWDEIWQAMELLIQQGKIIYVGSSNFAGRDIVRGCESASRRKLFGLVSEQCRYSLAYRKVELELLPACKDYGVAVIPFSPLGGGLLGGVLGDIKQGRRAGERVQTRIGIFRPRLIQWEAFCREIGHEPADVALAWMLKNPAITSPIIGPRTLEQLIGSAASVDIELDETAMKRLDEIWPGPGGTAPEAYAW